MSEINISSPIKLQIEIIEIEDYIPSIKTSVNVEIIHPTGVFIYRANDLWFKCQEWDKFTNNIRNIKLGLNKEASLKDISEYFELKISSERENTFLLIFNCFEAIGENEKANINFSKKIKFEELYHISDNFMDFHKIWK